MINEAGQAVIVFLVVKGIKEMAATMGRPVDGARTLVIAGVVAAGVVGAYNAAVNSGALPPDVVSLIGLLLGWVASWAGSAGVNGLVKTVSPRPDPLMPFLASLSDTERAALTAALADPNLETLAPTEPRRLLARLYTAVSGKA